MIRSPNSSSSSSLSSSVFDSLRPFSIEQLVSELNFLVDESQIRPLTPSRSPPSPPVDATLSQRVDNDFVKEINRALHEVYKDSVQNNRVRYRKAMAHLDALLNMYNSAKLGREHPTNEDSL